MVQLRTMRFFAEKFSGAANPAGVRFDLRVFDNRLSPAQTLAAFRTATEQGARYLIHGQSSSTALALLEAVERHNRRHPGREVLMLNPSALDPALTNGRCSRWHFRFDADVGMRMEALGQYLAGQPKFKRVYLVNQNFAQGLQVAKATQQQLARKRPDMLVVGDEKHPLAQWRDFAPLLERVRDSEADAIITGNWGSDLAQLLAAAAQANFPGAVFTFHAAQPGTPQVMGRALAGQVYQVAAYHPNMEGEWGHWQSEYRQRYGQDLPSPVGAHLFRALSTAITLARSSEVVPVERALSGLLLPSHHGPVELRASDHQLLQKLYVSRWQAVDTQFRYNVEQTGMTFAPVAEIPASELSRPSTCLMNLP